MKQYAPRSHNKRKRVSREDFPRSVLHHYHIPETKTAREVRREYLIYPE